MCVSWLNIRDCTNNRSRAACDRARQCQQHIHSRSTCFASIFDLCEKSKSRNCSTSAISKAFYTEKSFRRQARAREREAEKKFSRIALTHPTNKFPIFLRPINRFKRLGRWPRLDNSFSLTLIKSKNSNSKAAWKHFSHHFLHNYRDSVGCENVSQARL